MGQVSFKAFRVYCNSFSSIFYFTCKFGLDKRSLHLSNLIWSKQIDRDAAILELKNDICKSDVLIEDYYFFLKKLDLSEKEFKEICLRENKKFSDYPNMYFIYKNLKKIIHLFK